MKKKILVADDEPELLELTVMLLKKTGYEVSGAADGREALDRARQKTPDLIILDIYLPEIDGDEVTKLLKKDEKIKHIPVILISATTQTLEARVRECGAVGGFSKPFDPEELVAMVKKHIG
ncbi:MAG: response regulator [Candidatus Omnitrophota bacterium]